MPQKHVVAMMFYIFSAQNPGLEGQICDISCFSRKKLQCSFFLLHRLAHLTNTTHWCKGELEGKLKLARHILSTAEMCQKLETTREKVLPFNVPNSSAVQRAVAGPCQVPVLVQALVLTQVPTQFQFPVLAPVPGKIKGINET